MKRIVKKLFGRKGDISDYAIIDMADVKYIELWQDNASSTKTLAYYTTHGSYLDIQTIFDASLAYKQEGLERITQSTLIQTPLIKDKKDILGGTVIYFVDGTHIFVRKKV